MKKLILVLTLLFIVILSSCKKNNDLHICGDTPPKEVAEKLIEELNTNEIVQVEIQKAPLRTTFTSKIMAEIAHKSGGIKDTTSVDGVLKITCKDVLMTYENGVLTLKNQ